MVVLQLSPHYFASQFLKGQGQPSAQKHPAFTQGPGKGRTLMGVTQPTLMQASLAVSTVKEVAPEARRRDAELSFAFVYPDKWGKFVVRQVGRTNSYLNARRADNGRATLSELKFQIGDYLDVAITFQDRF